MYSLSELLQDKAVITVKYYLNTMSLAAKILFQLSLYILIRNNEKSGQL